MKLLWWVLGGAVGLGLLAAVASASGPSSLPSDTAKDIKGRGTKILWIGDSISVDTVKGKTVQTLGHRVKEKLKDAGFVVVDNSLGGRNANTFIKGHKGLKEPKKGLEQIADHLRDDRPDIAVIMLGTNDLAGLATKTPVKLSITEANFNKIVKALQDGGVTVIGIGAPHYPERPEFYSHEKDLREALERVYGTNYIDVSDITGKYHMHGTGKSAEEFAEKIYNRLSHLL